FLLSRSGGPIMTEFFVVLFVLVATILLLVLLEPVTRRCRRCLEEYEAYCPNPSVKDAPSVEAATATDPGPTPITYRLLDPLPSESFADQVRKALSAEFLSGCAMFGLLLIFFPMNARILAEGFEILFDRVGNTLAILTIHGWNWEVTDLQLYGLALSL